MIFEIFRKRVEVQLLSVRNLLKTIEDGNDAAATAIFHDFTFVGLIDSRLALIQYQSKLLMINYQRLR
jgi:hypothetical protein